MSNPYVSLAAATLLGMGAPALATAAAPAPAARPPVAARPAPQPVTRAAVSKGRDDAFKQIDTNGDGTINATELAAAQANLDRRRMDAEFTKFDTNKDGQLSKAEFLAAAPPAAALVAGTSRTISALDKNKDGKLTADEFRAPQLAVFDKFDTNHDGTLSATERQAANAARPK
ncbi:MAG: EF-hand domain-containing protein [Sphingomicrobium sp.]